MIQNPLEKLRVDNFFYESLSFIWKNAKNYQNV